EVEATVLATPGAGACPREPVEAMEARLALRVDLAAVELGALLLVAENFIGGIDLGKLLLGLGIILVLVGMIGLGELAERLLDVRVARRSGTTENAVWIAHGYPVRERGTATNPLPYGATVARLQRLLRASRQPQAGLRQGFTSVMDQPPPEGRQAVPCMAWGPTCSDRSARKARHT